MNPEALYVSLLALGALWRSLASSWQRDAPSAPLACLGAALDLVPSRAMQRAPLLCHERVLTLRGADETRATLALVSHPGDPVERALDPHVAAHRLQHPDRAPRVFLVLSLDLEGMNALPWSLRRRGHHEPAASRPYPPFDDDFSARFGWRGAPETLLAALDARTRAALGALSDRMHTLHGERGHWRAAWQLGPHTDWLTLASQLDQLIHVVMAAQVREQDLHARALARLREEPHLPTQLALLRALRADAADTAYGEGALRWALRQRGAALHLALLHSEPAATLRSPALREALLDDVLYERDPALRAQALEALGQLARDEPRLHQHAAQLAISATDITLRATALSVALSLPDSPHIDRAALILSAQPLTRPHALAHARLRHRLRAQLQRAPARPTRHSYLRLATHHADKILRQASLSALRREHGDHPDTARALLRAAALEEDRWLASWSANALTERADWRGLRRTARDPGVAPALRVMAAALLPRPDLITLMALVPAPQLPWCARRRALERLHDHPVVLEQLLHHTLYHPAAHDQAEALSQLYDPELAIPARAREVLTRDLPHDAAHLLAAQLAARADAYKRAGRRAEAQRWLLSLMARHDLAITARCLDGLHRLADAQAVGPLRACADALAAPSGEAHQRHLLVRELLAMIARLESGADALCGALSSANPDTLRGALSPSEGGKLDLLPAAE